MNTLRVAFRVVCALILIAAIVQVSTQARADSEHASAESHKTTETPSQGNVIDMMAEVENKKAQLSVKEQELQDYERRIKEREKELDKKIQEMERLRAAVSGELEAQKKNNEERVLKMVSVFETMSPKSASGVMETLDDWLAVEVLKRMEVKRVAKIMNLMDKARSAKLSELLTGFYRPEAERKISSLKAGQATAEAVKTAAAPQQSNEQNQNTKGGEKKDEHTTRSR